MAPKVSPCCVSHECEVSYRSTYDVVEWVNELCFRDLLLSDYTWSTIRVTARVTVGFGMTIELQAAERGGGLVDRLGNSDGHCSQIMGRLGGRVSWVSGFAVACECNCLVHSIVFSALPLEYSVSLAFLGDC